ncbi:restriction endonuclease subunit S [Ancylobacter lacus]|uniref:restriction endonuclease subunit S n=1 Tax=Ancylobacter lacus TaxID=2579970 RepID=UPI001BCDE26F|nr:restriction endonuclease subunit S [Ancylobacter lacus]MBS7539846.1 restriction endonuclease subunit S [Ancylobacter lacus]
MSGLPKGWVEATLGELGVWQGGGTPDKSNAAYWSSGTIPWVSPKDMKRFHISEAEDQITEAALAGSSTNLIAPHSVLLVTRSGILKHTLPVALTNRDVAINQDIKALTPHRELDPVFIAQQIKSLGPFVLRNCAKAGTTVDSVDFERLKSVPANIPPLAEQKRIVAKLEALNATSARARAELARIETLASRYKQAVLSKAFSGELCRKELGELVARIKAGKNLRCEERPPRSNENGVVKVSAVTWGEFRADQSKTLPSDFEPDEDTRIKSGDFLFSRANTIDLVGAVVIVAETPENLYLSDKILRLEFTEPVHSWLLWYLRSPMGREALMNISSGNQLSMRNIGQKSLLSLAVPYADAQLRTEIVRRIESAFARIDRLAGEAKRALELVGRLDEAILAKAFRGELVPQDENDEPAEQLLARIRAGRAAAPKGKRGRGARD